MKNIWNDREVTFVSDIDVDGRYKMYDIVNACGGQMYIIYDSKKDQEEMSCNHEDKSSMLLAFCQSYLKAADND